MKVETDSFSGPASYSTGGITIATGLASVDHLKLFVSVPGANLPPCVFVYSRSGGNVTVKLMRRRYDKLTGIGAVTGLPAGVSSAATSGQTYVTEQSHTHSIEHDHGSVTSGTPIAGGGGVTLQAVSPTSISTHTHPFDVPNFTGDSGIPSVAHTHTWNNLYQHQHSTTLTETDPALSELPAGTNLSGATFAYRAIGT